MFSEHQHTGIRAGCTCEISENKTKWIEGCKNSWRNAVLRG